MSAPIAVEVPAEPVICLMCAAWQALERLSAESGDHSRALDARARAARHSEEAHSG
ncbi:hypothetical protein [Kitasatospora purpeofusca]|uniref:hypothetical protein n=1 Tax=Kitasatospora purpeofusca TaxID=67352 RepID=UPI002A5AC8C7|nr:hypothetical protein [Kitasatospora purpeofusca]MDY0813298.1 hypothetical protein [Kitasatospora purpeofusca]